MSKTYKFTVFLIGTGEDEDEAWMDAVTALSQDPGEPFSCELLEKED
jgi:hypothetical protein